MLKTPIALLIFNRPNTTKKVFGAIRKAKPKRLFVIADGWRNKDEKVKCLEARKVTENIDWECDVKRNYSDTNLGCKIRVSSGIDWFFDNVEEGIILEDDTVPSQSFFRFCSSLLEKYRDNEKVMLISGDNFQRGKKRGAGSYYFSKYANIWGWATWRRAWKHYDVDMKSFKNFDISTISSNKEEQEYWMKFFTKVYNGEINTWDYQWVYAIMQRGGLSIVPNVNLVSNIGFGKGATHTKNVGSEKANLPTVEISKIIHPTEIKIDIRADRYTFSHFFIDKKNIFSKIKNSFKK